MCVCVIKKANKPEWNISGLAEQKIFIAECVEWGGGEAVKQTEMNKTPCRLIVYFTVPGIGE